MRANYVVHKYVLLQTVTIPTLNLSLHSAIATTFAGATMLSVIQESSSLHLEQSSPFGCRRGRIQSQEGQSLLAD